MRCHLRLLALFGVICLAPTGWAAAVPTPADPADAGYQKARACYYDLKKSPERQRQRGAWETCIRQFLEVERAFPGSDRAADAAFSVGKTYEELYTSSKNVEDLRLAIRQFDQFAKTHKRHRLADDALYRVGTIRWEGFKQKRQARGAMWRVIRWFPEGDMANEARKFIRELDDLKASRRPPGALLNIKPEPVRLTPATAPSAGTAARTPAAAAPPAIPPATPIIETTITDEGKPAPAAAPAKEKAPTKGQSPAAKPASFRIVIDPGHGGKDAGAIGPGGTQEKQITLAIARRLAAALRSQVPCEVTLTRERDVYLTLDQRNAVANRRKADLFISIHANAAASHAQRGIQTYYLNNASDEASRRLADRENRVAGKSLGDVQAIVSTMLQTALTDESRDLAKTVHRHLVGGLGGRYAGVKDQGVRTALFYVLVGAKSPSILVETSYLSHPIEERRLRDPRYQSAVAQAIAQGINRYVSAQGRAANL